MPPPRYEAPCEFEVGLWSGAVVLWGLFILAGRFGHPIYTVIIILMYSVVMVAIVLREMGDLPGSTIYKLRRRHFDPKQQSWAYMFGDSLALPWAGLFAALVGKAMPPTWFIGLEWVSVSAAFGAAASALFHTLDARAYRSGGFDLEVYARSKRWLDFATYFGLFGGFVYLGWPLVWGGLFHDLAPQEKLDVWLMLFGLAVWFGLAVCDAVRKPSPAFMHPPGKKWLPAPPP